MVKKIVLGGLLVGLIGFLITDGGPDERDLRVRRGHRTAAPGV
jgi:hypothetical protein